MVQVYHLWMAMFLLGAASACDSGLDWTEKGLAVTAQRQPPQQQQPPVIDRSSWQVISYFKRLLPPFALTVRNLIRYLLPQAGRCFEDKS
jgi:hypothetical protein